MSSVEKVFSIEELRLLILSFYLDKVKEENNTTCKNRIERFFCNPIERIIFNILIRIYYSR